MLGGFFDGFTGKAQAKAHKQAYEDSSRYLNEGEGRSAGAVNTYSDQARGRYDPYVQQGGRANALYGNAVGANGAEAQRGFYDNFQHDPGWEAQQNAGVNALNRGGNAKGGYYGGAQMKALYNYGQQNQRQAYNDRLQQLSGLGGQGYQASNAQSGVDQQQGNALAGIYGGFAQSRAGNAINYGTAQAADSGTLWNNLIGIGSTIAANASKAAGSKGGGGGGGGGG